MAHILLVDDDVEIHRKMRVWLSPFGHTLENALNSTEARILLSEATDDTQFDLIICDNNMQTENEGVEFGASLWLTNVQTPFVLHTSSLLMHVSASTLKNYKIHYVQKSSDPVMLLQKIDEILQNKNATP